ncbi:MAG: phosphoglycerate kinase [Candidatus Saccharimonadales bacterium]
MAFSKKTIKDIDVDGKIVLLRADYNVPVEDGRVTGDYRIKQSLPTVKYLLEHDCKIIICSHLGRPKGPADKDVSLRPVAKRLSELLGRKVGFANDCVGPEIQALAAEMKPKEILMLENLRFHPEEEQNDDNFAAQLASLADVFVQDGFGVVHRKHASTDAITRHLPSVAGLLLAKEVDTITDVMYSPKRPLMAIIGGAKISDKIDFIKLFIEHAEFVAIGGAMANTFLLAEKIYTGKSLTEPDDVPLARHIMELARTKAKTKPFVFYLPQDGVVATKLDGPRSTRVVDWDAHVIADIESYPKIPPRQASKVAADEGIFDIGPVSGAFIAGGMQLASTVVWNGTMGVAEEPALSAPVGPFAHGTDLIVQAMSGRLGHRPFSLVGGGDTASYIENKQQTEYFDHVSTGGGASLDLMLGKHLPGVEALQDKDG